MTKINKEISILIFIIGLVVLWALFIDSPVDTKIPIQEHQVGGLLIEFKDGTTEPEVKAILENCNITLNYTVDYDSKIMSGRYYIEVKKDEMKNVREELSKNNNWTDPIFPDFKKGKNYIITVTEQVVQDKDFHSMIEKNNLKLKKSIYCYVHFINIPHNEISEEDAIVIKNKLDMNDNVLVVSPNYSTR